MKVENTMYIYESNGKENKELDRPELKIHSHWNRNEMVTIEVDDKKHTVVAAELQKAITNATNWRSY